MSTHNIGFYEDLTKLIFQLLSNTHLMISLLLSEADMVLICWKSKQDFNCFSINPMLTVLRRLASIRHFK